MQAQGGERWGVQGEAKWRSMCELSRLDGDPWDCFPGTVRELEVGPCLGYGALRYFLGYNQTPDKSNLRKGLFCLIDWGAVHHGCEVMATGA